jgi:hypothetical protein
VASETFWWLGTKHPAPPSRRGTNPFFRCVACQVSPLTRLGEGAPAPEAPVD